MGRRLRVFVSSTMNELANERKAVCDRLADLNFEPVNAEGWASRPATSSETIRAEIESSDLFLLILGTDYGWCPPDGRGPESVTHLEFHQAQDLGLPVFPFLKGLSYESSSRSREARKRDAFRKEVENWEGGYFRGAQFDLAEDLAREVGRALLQFLTDEFQRSRLSQRAPVAARALARLTSSSVAQPVAPYVAPPELSDAVRSGRAVLLAGAGLSLAAGMPAAGPGGLYRQSTCA